MDETTNKDAAAKWYVLHTFSNYEVVAKDNLEKVIKKEGLSDRIFEIFIPTEESVIEKRGAKVLTTNKTMPSYLFVKMVYGDDIWHTITRTNGITGFVGPKGRPLPLSAKEVNDLKLERRAQNVVTKIAVGDTVHVIDGLLAGQTAAVTAVNAETGKCTIRVTMFGQPKSVDVELFAVKKI
jgi:transcriptional antiterminator NusG